MEDIWDVQWIQAWGGVWGEMVKLYPFDFLILEVIGLLEHREEKRDQLDSVFQLWPRWYNWLSAG